MPRPHWTRTSAAPGVRDGSTAPTSGTATARSTRRGCGPTAVALPSLAGPLSVPHLVVSGRSEPSAECAALRRDSRPGPTTPDRWMPSGARGRRFESCRAYFREPASPSGFSSSGAATRTPRAGSWAKQWANTRGADAGAGRLDRLDHRHVRRQAGLLEEVGVAAPDKPGVAIRWRSSWGGSTSASSGSKPRCASASRPSGPHVRWPPPERSTSRVGGG
jgi:hypothetical protein